MTLVWFMRLRTPSATEDNGSVRIGGRGVAEGHHRNLPKVFKVLFLSQEYRTVEDMERMVSALNEGRLISGERILVAPDKVLKNDAGVPLLTIYDRRPLTLSAAAVATLEPFPKRVVVL